MSANGTFETSRCTVTMSVYRGRPEVIGTRTNRHDDPYATSTPWCLSKVSHIIFPSFIIGLAVWRGRSRRFGDLYAGRARAGATGSPAATRLAQACPAQLQTFLGLPPQSFKTAETPLQRISSSRLDTDGQPCLLREWLARPRYYSAMSWLRGILCTPKQRREFSSACPG